MTFEEWFVNSGWFGFGSAVEIAANDGYEAGYKQAIVDCYGEAAAPLVLESLRKATNRPVEPFSSGGEGKGSQTQGAKPVNQEPVAWQMPGTDSIITQATKVYCGTLGDTYSTPLYAAPMAQPLTDAQVDAAISAWFTYEQTNVDNHQKRMRRAIAAAMSKGS